MARVEYHLRAARAALRSGEKLRTINVVDAYECYYISLENYIDSVLAWLSIHPRRDGSRLSILEIMWRTNVDFQSFCAAWFLIYQAEQRKDILRYDNMALSLSSMLPQIQEASRRVSQELDQFYRHHP